MLVPAIARPDPEGGYELVAGHRRHRASELAEKETMPVIVRDLDDDAATIIMVDSNLQRESLLEFVMDCLQKNTTEIRNMKQYLLTVLFNAPTTISNHYTSQVNHDLYGGW